MERIEQDIPELFNQLWLLGPLIGHCSIHLKNIQIYQLDKKT